MTLEIEVDEIEKENVDGNLTCANKLKGNNILSPVFSKSGK